LPLAKTIIIAADHDKAGLLAAEDAAERFLMEGRQVKIAIPPKSGADFNDLLMEGK
jgi:DNA primase